MALRSCISDINFADQVNIRKAHEKLMGQVRNEAVHINNKYNVQIYHLHFEWDKFIPTLEKEFPDILNEMLSPDNQQQPFNSTENRSILLWDME